MAISKPHCTKKELLAILGSDWAERGDIKKALEQAHCSHRYHVRDDGSSYLEQHIYPIVCEVLRYLPDTSLRETLVIVTLLHDVLEEDPTVTPQMLFDDYGKEVVSLLLELQKIRKDKVARTQEDRHDEHVSFGARLEKASYLCRVIKTLDRINNVECTEGHLNPEKYRRFIQDTEEVYLPIAAQLDNSLAERMSRGIDRIKAELLALKSTNVK
jgi:(p)ppGpp synthase/HD superfamily hydrolase